MPQVLQLVAPQVEQEGPEPAIEVGNPLSLLEKAAKVDSLRFALLWQLGQEASSSA